MNMNKLWRRRKTWLTYRHWTWCWLGLHDWYYGFFIPDNKYERHCLDCDMKQRPEYHIDRKGTGHRRWVTFADVEDSL